MELYIYNGATDEHTQREYTADELAIRNKEIADYEAARKVKAAEEAAKLQIKENAIAKLAALGLTEDEAKAVIGV